MEGRELNKTSKEIPPTAMMINTVNATKIKIIFKHPVFVFLLILLLIYSINFKFQVIYYNVKLLI